LTLYIETFTM